MSYREQRNVTDLLRRMAYPRLISLESFRQPNFLLVADILRWFMKRYDPTIDIPLVINTEQQRVIFIRTFVQHMSRKAGLKLNPKRLYQADGYAVKEITKVIQFFTNATKDALEMKRQAGNDGNKDVLTQFYELQPSLHKVRATRELSTMLTEKGVTFFDLISREITNRTSRDGLLSKPFDLSEYEQVLKKAIGAIKSEEIKLKSNIDSGETTMSSLNAKIEKKRQELERSEQRLETMSKVRPAYMDEFEKLQRELEVLYHDYVSRFRILCHLQHQMDEMNRTEDSRRIDHKLVLSTGSRDNGYQSGQPKTIPGDEFSGSDIDDNDEDDSLLQQSARDLLLTRKGIQSRPQGTTNHKTGNRGDGDYGVNDLIMPSRPRSSRTAGRIPGGGINMYSGLDKDDEGSESDLLLSEGDNSDLGSDIDEEGDLGIHLGEGNYGKSYNNVKRAQQFSDYGKMERPTPPAPTVSRSNLDEELSESELVPFTKTMPNGTSKGLGRRVSTIGNELYRNGGNSIDSLTKPLQPEPRYNTIAESEISETTITGRPSTKHRTRRVNSGTGVVNDSADRPPTRRIANLVENVRDDNF